MTTHNSLQRKINYLIKAACDSINGKRGMIDTTSEDNESDIEAKAKEEVEKWLTSEIEGYSC